MLTNEIVRKMTLFWRTSTATATTCCHHYHEEQTQTDFYLQNSVPKLFFKLKTQSHLQAYMEASSKYTHPQCQAPSTTLWHFLQWNFQHHEPIQPFLVCRSAHNPWINKTQKPRPPKLMTTPPLSPRQPPPPPPWTHKKIHPTIKSNPYQNPNPRKQAKHKAKKEKQNLLWEIQNFRGLLELDFELHQLSSLTSSNHSNQGTNSNNASARSGLGFGHCWTRWWPTMAYATQSQRDVGDGETDAKRERDMGDGCINFYNYRSL